MLGLPNVEVEDRANVAEALRLTDEGLDFADALHLCSRPANVKFLSFDAHWFDALYVRGCGMSSIHVRRIDRYRPA